MFKPCHFFFLFFLSYFLPLDQHVCVLAHTWGEIGQSIDCRAKVVIRAWIKQASHLLPTVSPLQIYAVQKTVCQRFRVCWQSDVCAQT